MDCPLWVFPFPVTRSSWIKERELSILIQLFCFLIVAIIWSAVIVDMMWSASSNLCHLDFPIVMGLILQLWVRTDPFSFKLPPFPKHFIIAIGKVAKSGVWNPSLQADFCQSGFRFLINVLLLLFPPQGIDLAAHNFKYT